MKMINKLNLLVKTAEKYLANGDSLKSTGENWPLSFVQLCVKEVDQNSDEQEYSSNVADNEGFRGTLSPSYGHSSIYESKDPLKLWDLIAKDQILEKPLPGSLIIWNKSENQGHIGIVVKLLDEGTVECIEGTEDKKILKVKRSIKDKSSMSLRGFITPWH